jgi:hypothetical protein
MTTPPADTLDEDRPATVRDLTELETRVDHRFEIFEARVDHRFETLEASVDQRFDQVDQRFEQIDLKLDRMHDELIDRVGLMIESVEHETVATVERAVHQQTKTIVFGLLGVLVPLFAAFAALASIR